MNLLRLCSFVLALGLACAPAEGLSPVGTETVIRSAPEKEVPYGQLVVLSDAGDHFGELTLDFGLLSVFDYRDLSIRLANVGSAPVELDAVKLAADGDAFSILSAPPERLEPGEAHELTIRMRSNLPGTFEGSLTFSTRGEREASALRINLTAVASDGACLSLAPDDWNFGTIEQGCASPSKAFSLYNPCATGPLELVSLEVEDGPFEVSEAPTPGVLAEGGIISFRVRLAAAAIPGEYTSRITALFRGEDGFNSLSGTIRAVVEPPPSNGDTFTQGARSLSNVLIVVDDGAVALHQGGALAQNAADLAREFALLRDEVNFRVGVISADTSDSLAAGTLVFQPGTAPVLTSETSDFEQLLSGRLSLPFSTSTTATPLQATLRALSAPLPDPANAELLRSAPWLSLVILTARPDVSAISTDDFLTSLAALTSSRISVSVVGPFQPTTCGAVADDGRLEALVTRTAGLQLSVCEPTWGNELFDDRGSFTLRPVRTTFVLTAYPDQSQPITVSIDGTQVPRVDPTTGEVLWNYDPSQNAIQFPVENPPPEGSAVTVSYTAQCAPR